MTSAPNNPVRRSGTSLAVGLALVLLPPLAMVSSLTLVPFSNAASAAPALESSATPCSPGARTLAVAGEVLFPQTGNGGYRSEHSDVHLVYDAHRNRFLPGTHVVLTLRATQCLSELSLDFETSDPDERRGGPQLRLGTVLVEGQTAAARLARPGYPGNPHGPDDPDPRAHQSAQQSPVGGPENNPLPPACSVSLSPKESRHARDGDLCPATKLVITPIRPVPEGSTIKVRIDYTGRPGTHRSPSGARDGWWATHGGGVVNTEPLGNQAWMPLNNHPSAKPTYDMRVRTQTGKSVLSNGHRRAARRHGPDQRFPRGSTTTHWQSQDPIASYLTTVLVGDYTVRRFRRDGVNYRLVQDRHIPARLRQRNARKLAQLRDSTRFLQRFTGPYPFDTLGAAVTVPGNDDMEMQTLIVFGGSALDVSTLFHENMHMWWGDHVTQATYDMVFFKEGLATFAEILRRADVHAARSQRPHAFRTSLRRQFDRAYRRGDNFWAQAPSNPHPWSYFSGQATYVRPGTAYTALYLTLGHRRFKQALLTLGRRHGGDTVDRQQWENAFLTQVQGPACRHSLHRFFVQWFDTAYPTSHRHRPHLTGPGLAGGGFPRQC